ncbi:hypothetical protein GmHk_03G007700 [Glycine max]|nr:hypothetical protein GmHk_03G007700 [Glycine max]
MDIVFSSSPSSKAHLNQKFILNGIPCTTKFLTQSLLNTMYSFMKAVRLTNLNLEETMKCRIVYNHHRNTAKIGNGWRNFTQSQNFLTIIQIIFEFSNLISNFVLFWFCL